jgi:hypothetical protein
MSDGVAMIDDKTPPPIDNSTVETSLEPIKSTNREVTIIDIPEIDATQFIMSFMGTKYDAVGLLLWPFRIQAKDKYYCFEAVVECMRYYGIDINPKNKPVDGDMIFTYFNDRGYTI